MNADYIKTVVDAVKSAGGNKTLAAKNLGLTRSAVRRAVARAERVLDEASAIYGDAPEYDLVHPVAPGFVVKGTSIRYDGKGVIQQYWNKTRLEGRDEEDTIQLPDPKKIVKRSTLYDQTGAVTQQWIAEKPEDAEREKLWQEFAEGLCAEIPRIKPLESPATFLDEDLLVAYPVADHHFGMLAWAPESGDDYDLEIAERLLTNAATYLTSVTPPAKHALVAFLGDMMHYDSFEPVTPRSRHLLDAEGRYPKMVSATIRSMRRVIDLALVKHEQVHVILEIGNHDPSSAVFLAQAFAALYENEPRITIDTSPAQYHYFRFGNCLIGTHHGHQAKLDALPGIMARDRARDWGETLHRYWWTGHIHHAKGSRTVPNFADGAGCSVESFRILPPRDAYAAGAGYGAPRDAKAIILHREDGEASRITVTPAMLKRLKK